MYIHTARKIMNAICKSVLLLWATHPCPNNISRSSLKTPPGTPALSHPLTQNITKHDYVTKPVSLGEGIKKPTKESWSRPAPPLSGRRAQGCLLLAPQCEEGARRSVPSLHWSVAGSYNSMVFRKSLPSKPPTAQTSGPSRATPALLRADVMLPSIRHSLRAGSYTSTQRRAWEPSKPPTTNRLPGDQRDTP